jgi:hypothetical protein
VSGGEIMWEGHDFEAGTGHTFNRSFIYIKAKSFGKRFHFAKQCTNGKSIETLFTDECNVLGCWNINPQPFLIGGLTSPLPLWGIVTFMEFILFEQ